MRTTVESVKVTCDGCGAEFIAGNDFTIFAPDQVDDWMGDWDCSWEHIDNLDLCGGCWTYDDDGEKRPRLVTPHKDTPKAGANVNES